MIVQIGNYTLADGGRQGVADFRIEPGRAFQPGRYIRAGAISVFDRGNREIHVSFSVKREHSNILDAEYFLFEHVALCPPSGDLRFTTRNSEGSEKVVILPGAVLVAMPIGYTGVTTHHSYKAVAGTIQFGDTQYVWSPTIEQLVPFRPDV